MSDSRKTVKFAQMGQEPQGLYDRLENATVDEMQGGRFPSFNTYGPHGGAGKGLVSANQAVVEGLTSALGPIGGLVGMVGMPYIQQFANKLGIDMNQPLEYGYGGDPEAFAEQQAISASLMREQMLSGGRSSQKIISALSRVLKDTFGDKAAGITDFLSGLDPSHLGMFLQTLSSFVPQIPVIMSRIDPGFMMDFKPITDVMYMKTGGKFDPAVLEQTITGFREAYNNGYFGKIPAQLAANSLAFATENLGPHVSYTNAANYAKAASTLVSRGLAPSFGEALVMADAMAPGSQAAFSPGIVEGYANYLDAMARRGMVDRRMISEAAKYATKNGLSMGAAMNAVIMGANVRQKMRGAEGKTYADLAANAVAEAGQSTHMKILAAAYEGDKKARQYIDRALASGDVGALNKLSRRLSNDPRVIERAQFTDANFLVDRMATQSPKLLDSFVQGEVRRAAGQNKELAALLASPDKLAARLKTRDFSGLSTDTVRALKANGGRLGAVALSTGAPLPSYYKPVGAPRLESRRIGLPYPELQPIPKPEIQVGNANPSTP